MLMTPAGTHTPLHRRFVWDFQRGSAGSRFPGRKIYSGTHLSVKHIFNTDRAALHNHISATHTELHFIRLPHVRVSGSPEWSGLTRKA